MMGGLANNIAFEAVTILILVLELAITSIRFLPLHKAQTRSNA
jgi:hypothetical protein